MARYSFVFVYGVLGKVQVFYLILISAPLRLAVLLSPLLIGGWYSD